MFQGSLDASFAIGSTSKEGQFQRMSRNLSTTFQQNFKELVNFEEKKDVLIAPKNQKHTQNKPSQPETSTCHTEKNEDMS